MANKRNAPSFEELLQASRKQRQSQKLAEDIFGRNSREKAAAAAAARLTHSHGASLASRVGIAKRTSSLPRSDPAAPRNARPSHPSRPERRAPKSVFPQTTAAPPTEPRNDAYNNFEPPAANGGPELSIRGAAAGPYVVVASNFAPGTTAADIESVMQDIGGVVSSCVLVNSDPVTAEMAFVEKKGAEEVINMFNGKKADGLTLQVYSKPPSANDRPNARSSRPLVQPEPEPLAAQPEDIMEVDKVTQSREAENRLREERRGGRPEAREAFPSGPRGEHEDRHYTNDYYRGPTQSQQPYQDSRYGVRGGNDRYGGRGGGSGRYRDEGRLYSDGMRRGGGGGQSWRP